MVIVHQGIAALVTLPVPMATLLTNAIAVASGYLGLMAASTVILLAALG